MERGIALVIIVALLLVVVGALLLSLAGRANEVWDVISPARPFFWGGGF